MALRYARWTALAAATLLSGSVISCKKKDEPAPAASATAAPEPPKPEVKDAGKKDDDEVKRYDDEQKESGTVRVAVDRVRVHVDADPSSKLLTTLNKGTLVNRLARKGNFLLIEYPSGVGQLSPGWVLAVQASTKVEKVDPDAVKNQKDASAPVVKVDAAAAVATAKADASAPAPVAVDAGAPKPAPTPQADAGAAAPAKSRPGRLKLPNKK